MFPRGEVGGLYQTAPDVRVSAVVGCGCSTRTSGYETTSSHIRAGCVTVLGVRAVNAAVEWAKARRTEGRGGDETPAGVVLLESISLS